MHQTLASLLIQLSALSR